MATARHPILQWAQRKDKVGHGGAACGVRCSWKVPDLLLTIAFSLQLFVTIDVQDAKDVKTDLANVDGVGKLSFSGTTGDIKYELNLPLLKEIDAQASKVSATPRHIFLIIAKVGTGWPMQLSPLIPRD